MNCLRGICHGYLSKNRYKQTWKVPEILQVYLRGETQVAWMCELETSSTLHMLPLCLGKAGVLRNRYLHYFFSLLAFLTPRLFNSPWLCIYNVRECGRGLLICKVTPTGASHWPRGGPWTKNSGSSLLWSGASCRSGGGNQTWVQTKGLRSLFLQKALFNLPQDDHQW